MGTKEISHQVWTGTRPRTGTVIDSGKATIQDLQTQIVGRSRWIVWHREEITCDHLVYAVKFFGKNGDIYAVNFYELQLNEKEFERIAVMKNCIVYAYHNPNSSHKNERGNNVK